LYKEWEKEEVPLLVSSFSSLTSVSHVEGDAAV
jgi:hypothetical protein